jgi:predicted transcriptional regulator
MVNHAKVVRKLPSLLIDNKTIRQKGWNEFMKKRYQLKQLKKRNPQRLNTLTNELVSVLEKIDRELKAEVNTHG